VPRIESETCSVDTDSFGKIVEKFFCNDAPTAVASLQPTRDAKLTTVSPLPRAMSLARASRLPSMKTLAVSSPSPVAQLLVPDVIPNVCELEVPLVVAAKT